MSFTGTVKKLRKVIINFPPKILWHHPKITYENNVRKDMKRFLMMIPIVCMPRRHEKLCFVKVDNLTLINKMLSHIRFRWFLWEKLYSRDENIFCLFSYFLRLQQIYNFDCKNLKCNFKKLLISHCIKAVKGLGTI